MKTKMGKKTGLIVAKYLPGTFFFLYLLLLYLMTLSITHIK